MQLDYVYSVCGFSKERESLGMVAPYFLLSKITKRIHNIA